MTYSKRCAALLAAALFVGAQANPRILYHEPGRGQLHEGEMVYVDDGACPPGRIKRVTAGSNRAVSSGTAKPGSRREVACVPHP